MIAIMRLFTLGWLIDSRWCRCGRISIFGSGPEGRAAFDANAVGGHQLLTVSPIPTVLKESSRAVAVRVTLTRIARLVGARRRRHRRRRRRPR